MPKCEPIKLSAALREAVESRLELYQECSLFALQRNDRHAKAPALHEDAGERQSQDDEPARLRFGRESEEAFPDGENKLDETETAFQMAVRTAFKKELSDLLDNQESAAQPLLASGNAEVLSAAEWRRILDTHKQTLAAINAETYAVTKNEPLGRELDKAKISHADLFGGAAYALCLEALLSEAKAALQQLDEERKSCDASLTNVPDKARGGSLTRLFSKLVRNFKTAAIDTVKQERLNAERLAMSKRIHWLEKEKKILAAALPGEFWRVYTETACCFLPQKTGMPVAVRAFLRFGALGVSFCWMPEKPGNILKKAAAAT